MHEHKLVAGVLEEVLRVAQASGSKTVRSIRIRLSRESHVTEKQFRDHFELLASGTPADAARLEITSSPDLDGELRIDSIDVAD